MAVGQVKRLELGVLLPWFFEPVDMVNLKGAMCRFGARLVVHGHDGRCLGVDGREQVYGRVEGRRRVVYIYSA